MWARAFRLNVEAVGDLLKRKNRDWSWIGRRVDVDRTTVERWRKGKPLSARHLACLARWLQTPMQAICLDPIPDEVRRRHEAELAAPECVEVELPSESRATWTEERRNLFLEGVRLIVKSGSKVVIVGEQEGSMKVTLRLTAEDADRLLEAQQDGRLAALGVASVRRVPGPEAVRGRWAAVAGGLSLACWLAMLAPVYAPPFYLTGVGLAAVAAGLGRRRWSTLILPAAGLVANTGGLLAWPWVVGFLPHTQRGDRHGYRFGLGSRVEEAKVVLGASFDVYGVDPKSGDSLKPGDRLEIDVNGTEAFSWENTPASPLAEGRLNRRLQLPLDISRVTVRLNGTVLFEQTVDIGRLHIAQSGRLYVTPEGVRMVVTTGAHILWLRARGSEPGRVGARDGVYKLFVDGHLVAWPTAPPMPANPSPDDWTMVNFLPVSGGRHRVEFELNGTRLADATVDLPPTGEWVVGASRVPQPTVLVDVTGPATARIYVDPDFRW